MKESSTIALSLDNLDEISVLHLELMDDLIACKKDIETSLREGFFLLGKARYIMGVSAVSMLQVPSEDCDISSIFCTTVSEEPMLEIPSVTNQLFNIHINENSPIEKTGEKGEAELRQRGETETKKPTDSPEEGKKKTNPLNWFSALPPQSLRKAQEHFKKAIIKSVECATIQSKLNSLNIH